VGNGEGAELVELFEKASKAADRAVADGEVVAAEEARCIEALKAMGTLPVSTSLLMSTQVHNPSLLPVFSLTPSSCSQRMTLDKSLYGQDALIFIMSSLGNNSIPLLWFFLAFTSHAGTSIT
jgi:hypothetical protein